MLTPEDIAALRPVIVEIVRAELRRKPRAPARPRPPALRNVHPAAEAVRAFLAALPVDGSWLTSRALHAAFLASPHATGLAARASVQVVGTMAARERGRLVETWHNGDVGTRYRRIAPSVPSVSS